MKIGLKAKLLQLWYGTSPDRPSPYEHFVTWSRILSVMNPKPFRTDKSRELEIFERRARWRRLMGGRTHLSGQYSSSRKPLTPPWAGVSLELVNKSALSGAFAFFTSSTNIYITRNIWHFCKKSIIYICCLLFLWYILFLAKSAMNPTTKQITYEQTSYKSISSHEAINNLLRTNPELTKFVESAIADWVDIVSIRSALEAFNKKNNSVQLIVVSGAYFWDEAKGKTVMALVWHKDVMGCVRANSGANAGHTVVFDGKEYKFHIMPSSILSGKISIIGDAVVMDPVSFCEEEVNQILKDGFSLDNLRIGNCDIVCPWHKVADLAGNPNASTGQGMRQVHSAKALKLHVRLDDIINNYKNVHDGTYKKLIKSYDEFMYPLLREFGTLAGIEAHIKASPKYEKLPDHIKKFLSLSTREDQLKSVWETLLASTWKLKNYRANTSKLLNKHLKNGDIFVVEWPQSFFLSNGNPIHPDSTTSAQVHASGILATLWISDEFTRKSLSINVTKVPSSRVGSGANPAGYVPQDWFSDRKLVKENMPNVDFDHAYKQFIALINPETGFFIGKYEKYVAPNGDFLTLTTEKFWTETLTVLEALGCACGPRFDEFWATTKKPRVCGSLDLMHMKHVAEHQWNLFSLSRVDGLDGLTQVPVVVGYSYDGSRVITDRNKEYVPGDIVTLADELPNEKVLEHCEPIYKILPGWKTSKWIQEGETLPSDLALFTRTIEELAWVDFFSLGNGKETDALIHLTKKKILKTLNFSAFAETFQVIEPWYLPSINAAGRIPGNKNKATEISNHILSIIEKHKEKILSLTSEENTIRIEAINTLMLKTQDYVRANIDTIDSNFWKWRAQSWIDSLEERKAA